MAKCRPVGLAVLVFWGAQALAIDVTGTWPITGASFTGITEVSFTQSGTTLTACLDSWGTVATGTIDGDTGDFTLFIDPYFASLLYEFGLCSLQWNGSFALDGGSLVGTEVYSRRCIVPPEVFCCEDEQSTSIASTRSAAEISCCGNGVVEAGEQCDTLPFAGQHCCANDCSFAPAGTFCGAIDRCHLKECDAGGVCEPLPPADCGACNRCDPAEGCRADIRSDCSVGGSGARMRAIRRSTETKLNWRWRKGSGPATTPADLGDPTASTEYEFCVFMHDVSPSGFPRVRASLPPGQGWKQTGSGFRYRDDGGSAAVIIAAQPAAKSDARSRLKVSGRDVSLFPPLSGEVVVQMSTLDEPSRCWSTTFTAPQVNETGRYIATLP